MALKRIHSSSLQTQSVQVPDLPKLGGDTLLQVFTHRSLRRADQPQSFDNERLSLLGEKFLHLLLTDVLFGERPLLTASEITTQKNQFLSSDNIVWLVRHYGLLNHLRCHPDNLYALNAPEEACSLFYAYVGGVFEDYDDPKVLREVVQTWRHILSPQTPPLKKIRMEPGDAPPFPNLPSVVPSTSEKPLPNPLAPAQPNSPFLPLFNQTASQRGVAVEYAANLIEGQWVVQCVVNGIPKGTASGSTKKIAQEGAAREAYHAMGWV